MKDFPIRSSKDLVWREREYFSSSYLSSYLLYTTVLRTSRLLWVSISGDGERVSSFRRTILLELKSSVTLRSAVLRFIFSQIMRLLKPCTTLTQSRITRCTMIKWRCDTNTFALAMWISHSFSKSAEQQNITQTSDFILRRGFQNEDSTHTHTEFFAMASHREQITLSTASENMAKV